MSRRKETQLTEDECIRIQKMRDSGYTLNSIAIRFNIGTTLVWRVINGRQNSKEKKPRARGSRNE